MLVPRTAEVILHVAGIDPSSEVEMDSGGDDATAPDAALREDAGTQATMAGAEFEAAPGLLLVPDEALASAIEPFIIRVAMHRSFERFNGNAMEPPATDITSSGLQQEDELLTAK